MSKKTKPTEAKDVINVNRPCPGIKASSSLHGRDGLLLSQPEHYLERANQAPQAITDTARQQGQRQELPSFELPELVPERLAQMHRACADSPVFTSFSPTQLCISASRSRIIRSDKLISDRFSSIQGSTVLRQFIAI